MPTIPPVSNVNIFVRDEDSEHAVSKTNSLMHLWQVHVAGSCLQYHSFYSFPGWRNKTKPYLLFGFPHCPSSPTFSALFACEFRSQVLFSIGHSTALTRTATEIPLFQWGWVTTPKLITDQRFFSPYSRTLKPNGSFIYQIIIKIIIIFFNHGTEVFTSTFRWLYKDAI